MAKERVQVRIDADLLARLDARAESERRTRTQIIELALDDHLSAAPRVSPGRMPPTVGAVDLTQVRTVARTMAKAGVLPRPKGST